MISLTLPWPPTLNTYWRHVGPRVLISAAGRAYRKAVGDAVLMSVRGARPLTDRLSVRIEAQPPDRRVRDLDNLLKAPADALTHAGLWEDDGQIDELTIVRLSPTPGGLLRVVVSPITDRIAA
jgi:crossover junction endodeoxyribonuclease RusA